MKITLSGATGLVGRRLVKRLLEDGHRLHLLVRNPRTGFGPEVECSIWNAMEIEPAPESVEGADAVIHLAGEPIAQRWTPVVKRRILESRVEGTRRLVEALERQEAKPRVMVCASAVGYYGSRGDDILTESSPPGEGFLAQVCQAWETAADEALTLGVRVVKLRLGVVLSNEGGALAQMAAPFRWGLGGRVGSGKQWMSWIHVDDLVELVRFTVGSGELKGAVNACSPNPVTNAEFTEALSTVLRRPALFTIPARALQILYGEMAQVLLASQRARPEAALRAGFEFQYPDLLPALRNLLG